MTAIQIEEFALWLIATLAGVSMDSLQSVPSIDVKAKAPIVHFVIILTHFFCLSLIVII